MLKFYKQEQKTKNDQNNCFFFFQLQMFLPAKDFLGVSVRKLFYKIKAPQKLSFSNKLKTQPE